MGWGFKKSGLLHQSGLSMLIRALLLLRSSFAAAVELKYEKLHTSSNFEAIIFKHEWSLQRHDDGYYTDGDSGAK